jgi:TolB-like protein/thioredoxin-like negative regulator of GroEL
MSFFQELKRRHVIRVGVMYAAAGWVLAEVAGFAADTFGAPAWVVQIFTILILLGFPLVLIGAWAFDLTPQGLKRDTGPDEPDDTQELAPVAAAAVVEEPVEDTPSAQSIAVLPFADMSPDKDQEYFSDGLSEELLNLLAKIPQLFVAARTSAFAYKGKDIGIEQIGRELKVAHVLEGSVRKAGNAIRITAQLIQAENGYHLWSETWDRTLEDIFAVQDEIAAIVVEQLKLTLLAPTPVVQETDPEAYALHLQGLHFYRQSSAEGFEQAVVLAEQALALAPDYVPAWDLLASAYMTQAGKGLRPIDEGYRLGREATEKALAINPDYAWAHAALSVISSAYDRDQVAAAHHMQTALTLDPTNPDMLRRAAVLAKALGRPDTAIAIEEYVAARDPVNHAIHHNLGISYYTSGRLDEAIASWRTALRLSPGSIATHALLGDALLAQGDAEAALEEMEQELDEGFRLIGQVSAYHDLGRSDESDAALAELIEKHTEDSAYNIAYVLAYRGAADRAFEWLDKAVKYRDPGLTDIILQPKFATIHSDPRWETFLTSIGKSKAQLDAIEFDVKLPQ